MEIAEMRYIDYPRARTWFEALKALHDGFELWVEFEELPEDSEEGECYEVYEGDIAEMMDGCSFFSNGDMTYEIHLVPVEGGK